MRVVKSILIEVVQIDVTSKFASAGVAATQEFTRLAKEYTPQQRVEKRRKLVQPHCWLWNSIVATARMLLAVTGC